MVKKKQVSFTKALSYWVVGILILGLIILIPAELVTRLLQDKSPYYKSAFIDNHYGWKTKANYKEQKKIDVIHGESYTVDYNTGHEGFRPYGDPNSSLPKLLVIGDSYTQAVEANNGRAYADVLADSLGLELFTYGQAGYGTYQQYLILHAYIDAIRPQILLLQVCDNDFIDNYTPLEYTSNYKVGEKRPYLQQDGTTTFERPVPKWQRIIDKSAFLEILRKKFQTTFAEVKPCQYYIAKQGREYEPYDNSVKITHLAFQKIKSLADSHGIPMVVLVAGDYQPYVSDFQNICDGIGVTCLTYPAKRLKELQFAKKPVRCADGYHWSEQGHQIVAEIIQDTISNILHLHSLK